MNKNWNETVIEIPGTLKTNEEGKIVFTENKFGKFTATLKVSENTAWNILARKSTFVFVDGLRKVDVDAFQKLEAEGEINATTAWVITGHLVRTPGKPGMNDLLNLKTMRIRPKADNEEVTFSLDEALTKDEWQVIRNEKFKGTAMQSEAPTAPEAPICPF